MGREDLRPRVKWRGKPHVYGAMKKEVHLRLVQIGKAVAEHGSEAANFLPGWARPPTTEDCIDPDDWKQEELPGF